MIELHTHTEYLLLHSDEVSVPGLGTFICKEVKSKRVEEEGIFLPPLRTVSFSWNKQEAGNDFVTSFSKLHNLSRIDAQIICAGYVDELYQALEEDSTVPFGSMGYLLHDADSGTVSFIPNGAGIASPAYYGLDAVPFAKLSHEVRRQRNRRQKAEKVRLTSIQADHDTITIRINRRAFNYASAVAASVVLFFAIISPVGKSLTNGVAQRAELLTNIERSLFSAKPQPVPAPETKTAEAVPVAKEETKTTAMQAEPKDYAIVLASAISTKRALTYAAQLQEKGYDAKALTVGKMVRVVITGFASEEEATAKIHQWKAECKDFSQAWPLKLKGDVKPIE